MAVGFHKTTAADQAKFDAAAARRRAAEAKAKPGSRVHRAAKLRESRLREQEAARAARPKPTPTQEPQNVPVIDRRPNLSRISPLQMGREAITGKADGKELSGLQRVKQATGAVRNVALAVLAGAAAAGYFGGGAGAAKLTVGEAHLLLQKEAIAARFPFGGAAARKLARIGWKITPEWSAKYAHLFKHSGATVGSFGRMVVANPKTLRSTAKIFLSAGILTVGVGALVYSILGTYPFAGFVGKEEATQTLGFGFKAAMEAGDLDLAEDALNQMDITLNAVDTLGDKVPIINVLNAIKDYVAGANITLSAQRALVQAKRDGTDEWSIIRQNQKDDAAEIQANRIEQQRVANEESARIRLEATEARDAEERRILKEELALWTKYKQDLIAQEKKDREEAAQFWLAYAKEKLKLREEQTPSKLTFGLLK